MWFYKGHVWVTSVLKSSKQHEHIQNDCLTLQRWTMKCCVTLTHRNDLLFSIPLSPAVIRDTTGIEPEVNCSLISSFVVQYSQILYITGRESNHSSQTRKTSLTVLVEAIQGLMLSVQSPMWRCTTRPFPIGLPVFFELMRCRGEMFISTWGDSFQSFLLY